MARFIPTHESVRLFEVAQRWVADCLVKDGSMLGDVPLYTSGNFDALDRWFVQRPDEGAGGFYEKLETQLQSAPASARKLMAELLWALFLFPSNIGPDTKREGILRVWGWAGEPLDPRHPLLADSLLGGIGSAGMGVNTNRWREVSYLVGFGQATKAVPAADRAGLFADYERYMEWVKTVPQEGDRQFRHMLRFFLFPDRVERMSSNGDRRRVLDAFGVAAPKDTRRWSDRELDDALLKLRRQQETHYGTKDLDFYYPPLREVWQKPNDDPSRSEVDEPDASGGGVNEPEVSYGAATGMARNLILYGPPGTGKTWRLQQMFANYTDQPADLDRRTWETQLVARRGWRAVIVAALADSGARSSTAELELHPLVKAKAAQRKRTKGVRNTLWGYMQEHARPDSKTVNVSIRRAPYVFDKGEDSVWYLVPDWEDQDAEGAELFEEWKAGPEHDGEPIRRYRVVTFHPSYSYEDFVVGLRPIVAGAGDEAVSFRMVDGVFKQACEEARSNPAKRYALFIDEINRANIAKVFGELITLIEPDKRARYDSSGKLIAGMEVQLPGTGTEDGGEDRFGVPENLDIIGTMNTADRSIALLDIALRRRFEFVEVPPEYTLLDRKVDGIDLGRLLRIVNDRLEFLADRDRLIGHAYLARVRTLEDLREVFLRQVIPLLQEYFFDDWSRVELVLSRGDGRSAFIRRDSMDGTDLFGSAVEVDPVRSRFAVTAPALWNPEDFVLLYSTGAKEAQSL